MTASNEEKWMNKKISRRDMLKLTGIGVAGVAIGASGLGGVMAMMFLSLWLTVLRQAIRSISTAPISQVL